MDGKKLEYKGEEALKEIETMTMNGVEIQERLLKEILAQNKETEYLNKYMKKENHHVTTDVIAEFKRLVPVTSYEDILPYMQRIENGEDSSLITAQPITEILCSSGTSGGKPKMMPSTAEDLDRRTFFYNLLMPIMNEYVPGLDEGKGMYLNFVRSDISTTPCGLPVRTAVSSYYKSKHFKCRQRQPWNDLTSPDQTILCDDINQSMHCQLLAGLVNRHQVLRIGASYASAFLKAISFLEHNWRSLSEDIRSGKLSSFVTDPGCRSGMSTVLSSPNPHLANEIIQICSQNSWKGILCELWPKAKYIETVITGSMAQYVPALQHYSDGKLPLVCLKYCTSEGFFGINIKPLSDPADIAYTLLPNMGYFEFLPLGDNGTPLMDVEQEQVPINDKLVDLGNVKLGCLYEIVVTTFAGLYRYRVGDALQVVGFYNKAPQFRFMCRQNVVISIDHDKTSEEDLHKSVTVAKKLLEPQNVLLVDYTSYPDTCLAPGHNVLYWEILHQNTKKTESGASLDTNVLQECCIAVEEQLDYVYCHLRNDGSIGPLEIRVVEAGTFDTLLDLFISLGASINQYKTPRGIKSDKALNLLNSKVTASFFSPRYPKWGSKKVS
ncbi:putative indole-3-acetic acid-amido synthetase GH3.9 [Lotus japonicus]|uniref:putative indole-3-acetic acid-amido synthetase GH3.9 n=1 Tax=Lotus japonicus TaxID=34305 RepID=UPI00258B319F|nr:putative indole-3-acetic acid-amido synthetase GH3.9 [Lotus japonicus]